MDTVHSVVDNTVVLQTRIDYQESSCGAMGENSENESSSVNAAVARRSGKSLGIRKPSLIGKIDVTGGRSSGIAVLQGKLENTEERANLTTAMQQPSTPVSRFEVLPNGSLAVGETRIYPGGLSLKSKDARRVETSRPLRDDLVRLQWFGKGSSATVYKALHVPSMCFVAEKVLGTHDPSMQQLVVSEITALLATTERPSLSSAPLHAASPAHVPSEFVVGIYDVAYNPVDNSVSIIEELMTGGSLQSLVEQHGALAEPVVAYTAYCILQGLCHLKSLKLVHGDIKPENLLLDHHGGVKVSDFGIAQKLSDVKINSVRKTGKASQFMGSFKYMSPERLEHRPYSYNADIWSLGLVLYTLACGRYPIDSNDKFEVMDVVTGGTFGVSEDELLKPLYENDTISESLRDFVRQCLIRDPSSRPNAEDLLRHPFIEKKQPQALKLVLQGSTGHSENRCSALGRVLVEVRNEEQDDIYSTGDEAFGVHSRKMQTAEYVAWLSSHWLKSWAENAPLNRDRQQDPQLEHKYLGMHHQLDIPTPVLDDVFERSKEQASRVQTAWYPLTSYDYEEATSCVFSQECVVGVLRKRATKRPLSFLTAMKWDDRVFVLSCGELRYHKPMMSEMGDTCKIGPRLGTVVLQPHSLAVAAADMPEKGLVEFQQCGAGAYSISQGSTSFLHRCIVLQDVLINGRDGNECMYLIADSDLTADQWLSALRKQISDLRCVYSRFVRASS